MALSEQKRPTPCYLTPAVNLPRIEGILPSSRAGRPRSRTQRQQQKRRTKDLRTERSTMLPKEHTSWTKEQKPPRFSRFSRRP